MMAPIQQKAVVLGILAIAVIGVYVAACPLEPYCMRGPYGVPGGSFFTDYHYYQNGAGCGNITKIEVFHSGHLVGLQFTYNKTVTPVRGSNCSSCTHEIHELQVDEWITQIDGIEGQKEGGSSIRIVSLTFHTNKGNVFGPYGAPGTDLPSTSFQAIVDVNNTAGMHYMTGYQGDNLDVATFYFKCNV